MSDSTFGFIGLGLIGGSIARGLRRANKDITIMAYMRTYFYRKITFSKKWIESDGSAHTHHCH